jgi:endonuclease/exonuclease/phosphatase family metal-dependent hydrolase
MESLEQRIGKNMNLKVISYNILHGFYSNYDPQNDYNTNWKPLIFEKDRLEAAQKLIKKENPDILILNEACFGAENKTKILMDYKKIFDFPYYSYAQAEPREYEWGSALLSKYPIVNAENLSEPLKPLLRAQVNIKEVPLYLDIAHPHPDNSNQEKDKFFKRILESRNKDKNYILAGDFNSLSPEDKYNREKLIRGFKTFDKNPEQSVNNLMEGKTIQYLLSHGLVDTHRKIHKKFVESDYTMPTDFLSKNKESAMRIDYIFCSPDIKIKDAGIIRSKEAEKASDHYPVYADLEI